MLPQTSGVSSLEAKYSRAAREDAQSIPDVDCGRSPEAGRRRDAEPGGKEGGWHHRMQPHGFSSTALAEPTPPCAMKASRYRYSDACTDDCTYAVGDAKSQSTSDSNTERTACT